MQIETCVEICGDGVALEVECDDGNIVNDDGCSDKCQIEEGFECEAIDTGDQSVCRLTTQLQINGV